MHLIIFVFLSCCDFVLRIHKKMRNTCIWCIFEAFHVENPIEGIHIFFSLGMPQQSVFWQLFKSAVKSNNAHLMFT